MTVARFWRRALIASLVLTLCLVPAAAQTPQIEPLASPVATDPIPHDAIRVCSDCEFASMQDAIDAAPSGATIVVQGGSFDATVHITQPVRLVGEDWPVIDARHEGTGVLIESDDVIFEGFEVRNSGRSFDKEDSGIYIEGQRVQILNNRVLYTLFGINAATAHDLVVAGNYITGQKDISEGLRGDGIKVWYSHRTKIYRNEVTDSRDLLVWYSNEVQVYENVVTHSRYGFHFMNSDDGYAARNEVVNNSVGVYLMYGKRIIIEDNLLQGSRGPSGHGLGLKEVDGVVVRGNIIYDNRIGIYIDNSPFSYNVYGEFYDNLIAFNDSGLGVLPSARSNLYQNNSFVENLEHVSVLGMGQLNEGNQWSINGRGNFWSDYDGFDSDGNGVGDVPYRSENLSERLMRSYPELQLFRFSLAETAVDFAAEAVPLFSTEPILIDEGPLVRPETPQNAPSPHQEDNQARTTLWSVGLLAGVTCVLWWGTSSRRHAIDAADSPER